MVDEVVVSQSTIDTDVLGDPQVFGRLRDALGALVDHRVEAA